MFIITGVRYYRVKLCSKMTNLPLNLFVITELSLTTEFVITEFHCTIKYTQSHSHRHTFKQTARQTPHKLTRIYWERKRHLHMHTLTNLIILKQVKRHKLIHTQPQHLYTYRHICNGGKANLTCNTISVIPWYVR